VAARNYSSTAVKAMLTDTVSAANTTWLITSSTGWPAPPFTLVVDRNLAVEEIVTATAIAGLSVTVVRGEDGTPATMHGAGAFVEHSVSGRDFAEANTHVNASASVHGLIGTVVGTNDPQTLDAKTFRSGSGSNPPLTVAAKAGQTGKIIEVLDATGASTWSILGDGTFNRLPTPGTTASRPAAPPPGSVRWNIDTAAPEFSVAGVWTAQNVVAPTSAATTGFSTIAGASGALVTGLSVAVPAAGLYRIDVDALATTSPSTGGAQGVMNVTFSGTYAAGLTFYRRHSAGTFTMAVGLGMSLWQDGASFSNITQLLSATSAGTVGINLVAFPPGSTMASIGPATIVATRIG